MSQKVEITAAAVRESADGMIKFVAQKNAVGKIQAVPTKHTFKGKEYFSVSTKPSIAEDGSSKYCQNAAAMLGILWKTGMVHATLTGQTAPIDCATLEMGAVINSANFISLEIVKLVGKEVELHVSEKGVVTAVVATPAQPVAPAGSIL